MGVRRTDGDARRAEIAAARARGARARATEPRAADARFDTATRCLVVRLTNGVTVSLPADRLPALAEATDAQLATVEVGPAGVALRWDGLDADLGVPALARLAFGGRAIAQAAGARAGSVRTAAKAEAARANGAKGGRPRRS